MRRLQHRHCSFAAVAIGALAVIASLVAATPSTTLAGPRLSRADSAARGKALKVFKQGKTAYKAGDYDAALKFFREAQSIYSHEALIILALAKTLDRAKQTEKARKYYTLFLTEAPPTDRARPGTVKRVAAIDAMLAARPGVLVFKGLPTAALLHVDGKPREPNAKGELEVKPGSYEIKVTLEHHFPYERKAVKLKPGERLDVSVVLKRIPDPSTLPRDHMWTWVAGTATGAAAISAGVLGLQWMFARNEYLEYFDGDSGNANEKARKKFNCEGKVVQCPDAIAFGQDLKAEASTYQTATMVTGLVAAGLGVATVVAYFAAPVKDGKSPSTALWITPATETGVGFALHF